MVWRPRGVQEVGWAMAAGAGNILAPPRVVLVESPCGGGVVWERGWYFYLCVRGRIKCTAKRTIYNLQFWNTTLNEVDTIVSLNLPELRQTIHNQSQL